MTLNNRVASKLQELRKKKNICQRYVATALGYKDASPISRIENGQVPLTLDIVEAFTKALGVTEAEVLGIGAPRVNQTGRESVSLDYTSNGTLTITISSEVLAQAVRKPSGK